MYIESVFNRYDEEIIRGGNELYFMDNIDDTPEYEEIIIDPYKNELYGTKNKKSIIELLSNLSDDNINIVGVKIPKQYLKDKICRIEIEVNDQIIYWIDEYILLMLLNLIDIDDDQLDIMKFFMPNFPIYYFKNDINIILTFKPEFINSDECVKKDEMIRVFKYRNYDIDYDRDFGYDKNAFNYTKFTKYFIDTPQITVKYNQNTEYFPKYIIPIIQLYRIFSGEDNGRLIIKNTLLIGISTQILFVTYPNSIDLTTIPFRMIMEKGIINNIFLKRFKNTEHIYVLNMPERKCKIRDQLITITYPYKGYISEIYASFTNAISLNEHIGRLVYFVHH